MKTLEVLAVAIGNFLHERLRRHACRFSFEHRRGTVGVAGTYVEALVPLHTLESRPDVRLRVLDEVA